MTGLAGREEQCPMVIQNPEPSPTPRGERVTELFVHQQRKVTCGKSRTSCGPTDLHTLRHLLGIDAQSCTKNIGLELAMGSVCCVSVTATGTAQQQQGPAGRGESGLWACTPLELQVPLALTLIPETGPGPFSGTEWVTQTPRLTEEQQGCKENLEPSSHQAPQPSDSYLEVTCLTVMASMLSCWPRCGGSKRRSPRKESTWMRLRRWIPPSRGLKKLRRNCPTGMGSTGLVCPDPVPMEPEERGSPGQVSFDLIPIYTETPATGQHNSGPRTSSGRQADRSEAEVCREQAEEADPPYTLSEPPEQAWLESCSSYFVAYFPDPSRINNLCPQEGILGRSMSDVVDTSLEVDLQVDPPAEALDQAEDIEPTETEAKHEEDWAGGSDPDKAEGLPVEPTEAPAADPRPAVIAEEEAGPENPWAPAAGQGSLVAPQQGSAPVLPLGPAPAPPLPFPPITKESLLAYVFALVFWIYQCELQGEEEKPIAVGQKAKEGAEKGLDSMPAARHNAGALAAAGMSGAGNGLHALPAFPAPAPLPAGGRHLASWREPLPALKMAVTGGRD
ncbi:uncharacterized protein LOC134477101 [Cavia porcellus]|uniref:uncharacterized protein LOC134477101 n=1 Tax=Cavia porcellus TaxID=10141 RepID=UPI002FDF5AB3